MSVHAARRQAILEAHPEVRALYGICRSTAVYGAIVCATQLVLATAVGSAGANALPLATLLGLTIGPFFAGMILVLIHETSHNLVFETVWLNRVMGSVVNGPYLFPMFEVFLLHHHMHHLHLGSETADVDVPTAFEIALVGRSPWLKGLWLAAHGAVLPIRSLWKLNSPMHRWAIFNYVCCGTAAAACYWYAGFAALVYLGLSSIMAVGLHPANARLLQRHRKPPPSGTVAATTADAAKADCYQGLHTYSYYGWSNAVTLNVGYHVEHHDFPRIPWTKLPQLRELAPEFYQQPSHDVRGWDTLWQFITDDKATLQEFYAD